jgi:hypothetical protein
VEWLPNKLTPLYSENYYKEENYLTIKIGSLYTLLPSIVMFGIFGIYISLVHNVPNIPSSCIY